MNRKIIRAKLHAQSKNQSVTFDVKAHFPTYREYELHRLADSVRATLRAPVLVKVCYAS